MDEYIYYGPISLEGNITIWLQCRTDARAPVAPDSAPTYRIYGPDASTIMTSGSGSFSGPVDSQTGLYKAVIACTVANGYASGSNYSIRNSYLVSSATKVSQGTFSVT